MNVCYMVVGSKDKNNLYSFSYVVRAQRGGAGEWAWTNAGN